jgi:hypothetical protein
MKFIRTFENFTEMDMGHQNMEDMCPDCQCNMTECECGSPMGYEDEMEDEYPHEEEEGGMPSFFGEEEEEMMPEEEEEEGRRMGHIMSFQEAKKAKPDFLDLDKDGDKKESMKKAAADKKKGGKKEDKKEEKESPKKGGLSKAQEKLPEGLRKAIAAKRKK